MPLTTPCSSSFREFIHLNMAAVSVFKKSITLITMARHTHYAFTALRSVHFKDWRFLLFCEHAFAISFTCQTCAEKQFWELQRGREPETKLQWSVRNQVILAIFLNETQVVNKQHTVLTSFSHADCYKMSDLVWVYVLCWAWLSIHPSNYCWVLL